MGTRNVSRSGFPCRRWDEVAGDYEFVDGSATEAQNYCRIPSSDASADYGLYCYVDHPYLSTEPCDVPLCCESNRHSASINLCRRWPVGDLWHSRITHSPWAENVVH